LVLNMLLWAAFGVYLLAVGQTLFGIIMFIFAVFYAILFYLWRNRIPFATAVLQTVSSIISEYPSSTYMAYISLIIHIIGIAFIFTAAFVAQSLTTSSGIAYLIAVFFVFSFYWYSQVVKNTVHVTTSGMVSTWYFLKNQMPSNPTMKSLKRAVTTSFGSICLGSLLVAILQTLRAVFRSLRNARNSFLICIIDCILGMLENLLRYFNLYAFTQVAVYGKTYCEAARDTWALIHSHGYEAIINDNLIGNVLSMGALLGGIICALVGGLVGSQIAPDFYIGCIIIGFIIGFAMLIIVMEVIQSGVATIFVCFAMDSEALRRNDPLLHQKFVQTYNL